MIKEKEIIKIRGQLTQNPKDKNRRLNKLTPV